MFYHLFQGLISCKDCYLIITRLRHTLVRGQDNFKICQRANGRQGTRFLYRLICFTLTRCVMFLFTIKTLGVTRVFSRSSCQGVRRFYRVMYLFCCRNGGVLQDYSGCGAICKGALRCHRQGITHTKKRVSRRVIGITPRGLLPRLVCGTQGSKTTPCCQDILLFRRRVCTRCLCSHLTLSQRRSLITTRNTLICARYLKS